MTTFTTAPYERSHGTAPRGRGSWAFRLSTTSAAYDGELAGEVFWVQGTLAEAKRAAAQHFGTRALVAVLS